MNEPAIPSNETKRVAVLRSLNILDTEADEHFDRITRLAATIFSVPTALVSLVDTDRQWFKSCFGLNATETPRSVSFCGHAILQDDVFIVEDASQDPRFADNPLVTDEPKIRFYAGHPIEYSGVNLGTLCLIDYIPRAFTESDCRVLKDLADMAAEEIRMRDLALKDELTGICNRRGFLLKSHHMLKVAERNDLNFDVVFIDINKFKAINDNYGHAEGDHVLKAFATALEEVCRESDLPARLAGDEFALLLNSHDDAVLNDVMARLKASFNQKLSDKEYEVTFSYGIAERSNDRNADIEALMAQADTIMYTYKHAKKV